jgi:hypothetical protein
VDVRIPPTAVDDLAAEHLEQHPGASARRVLPSRVAMWLGHRRLSRLSGLEMSTAGHRNCCYQAESDVSHARDMEKGQSSPLWGFVK